MNWKILPKKSDDLIEQLLINRGIKTEKARQQFFNPRLSDFEKDLEIAGIEKANKRIFQAIEKGELIVVFGDYDVDGICASAILYKALTSIGAKVLPYIPHREKEGYGLSKLGLEFARDSGASVVITVDNGIVAIDQANFAKEIGLDLIITDHHLPLDSARGKPSYPNAYAVVHSTKMCGAAVAWCLIREMVAVSLSKELLQFVAIATVCDLISLARLGRAFLVEGLKVLNHTHNLGLNELIHQCNIDSQIGSYEIGHIIGPRLNAIGRLEHAIDALRLLCTKDPIKAKKLARLLCDTNVARQQMTSQAIEEARLLIKKDSRIQVLGSKEWSSGIIGLIAGRICEECYRPVIAISVGESISKGSARSINGVNIVEMIRRSSDLLIDVGGHPGAAGFSIENRNLKEFKKRLERVMVDLPENNEPILEVDAEVESNKLTEKLIKDLEKFEPFGFGNPRPLFITHRMPIFDIRTVGEGKHLKFKIDDLDAIAFGLGHWKDLLRNGQLIDVVYYLELNKFNGSENLQLKVKDLRISELTSS